MATDWSALLAGYGAGLATLLGIREIAVTLPRVKVRFDRDFELSGGPVGAARRKLYVFTVTNARQRPVVIKQAGFLTKGPTILPSDWLQEIPFSLREGEYRTLTIVEGTAAYDLPNWTRPYAIDSVGRYWPRRTRFRVQVRWRVKGPLKRLWRRARRNKPT
jgi:hypothetical protein